MLYLIGMGLNDEKGLSIDALNTLKQCDKIYLEMYTNVFDKTVTERLSRIINKDIYPVYRDKIENEKEIVEEAAVQNRKIAIIVSGDPLIATTHINLLITCQKKGIKWRVFHNASIYSAAIGLSGLHVYKFGPCVTLSFWYENYKPMRTYDVIIENRKRGLHTLVLFDIKPDGTGMSLKTGIDILKQMIKIKGINVIPDNVLMMSNIGRDNQKMIYSSLDEIKNMQEEVCSAPYVLIIPGKLHYMEEEWLNLFKRKKAKEK